MQFSFQRFFLVATITVVGTVSVAAEPCFRSNDGWKYGQYDMTACNECAEHGNSHPNKSCCNALYHHSLGRDDDDLFNDHKLIDDCVLVGEIV